MQQLFYLIYKYRVFFTFLFLEVVALWLVVNHNAFQRVAALSSSGRIVAQITTVRSSVNDYFSLRSVNDSLAVANARLQKSVDSLATKVRQASLSDSTYEQFTFIAARVVNNSLYRTNNYLTINKGRADGIEPGMGVIGPNGIVGQVKACSDNFSTLYSALHTRILVSSVLKNLGVLGTAKWATNNPEMGSLLYIPLNVEISQGDTIVTSGFNAVFPEGITVGTVESVVEGTSESFTDVQFRYATNFRNLAYVYVVRNNKKAERDELEERTTQD